MALPTVRSVAAATVAGLATAAVVVALLVRFDYPVVESAPEAAALAATTFVLGFVPALVSAHTRLVAPVATVATATGVVAVREVTTPAPQWSELGGYTVVEGPTYVLDYASTWEVWTTFALVAGVVEFALRRGYAPAGGRLRNLPDLPLSGRTIAAVAVGAGTLFGLVCARLSVSQGISPRTAAAAVFAVTFVGAAAAVGVALASVLARGLVAPVVAFAALVPYPIVVEVFGTTDSPVHFLLFPVFALVVALAAAVEYALRSRFGGGGSRFVLAAAVE